MKTVSSEQGLRYLDWVKSRMAALADRLSGGRVGYIHLPDTALAGNRMLQKLFYPRRPSRPSSSTTATTAAASSVFQSIIELLHRI